MSHRFRVPLSKPGRFTGTTRAIHMMTFASLTTYTAFIQLMHIMNQVWAHGLTNNSGDMIPFAVSSSSTTRSHPSAETQTPTRCAGREFALQYKGKSCDLTVVDRCKGCLHIDLDMTITAFEKLGSKEEGRLHGMTWNFI
ncbi:hypothetical protein Pst134EA_032216 [Puccinia striiformis f. sp. tritici]|uniref:uncharacterized protein n=1 Tax=Puccinia striiformis f. sp. tritici TaxID=168172 RepID=UPI0020087A1D|nr:uncharacterized protein Pst134EA_032216 [Puccinia striiformis f. sp. tritici]KAH9441815.1 hypothetical protein Pst134EA_032216 [Puccinia striiformis f. sp. tritici]